ncbi:MAG: hypothetical protein HQ472_01470 [Ignavibacteria bacterium]|nr:hypothetical protein [Ignavibacteria bacterium]
MLNTRDVFRFWLPLCLTWLMMAAEGPILASVIARLDLPKYNLAAYGVALALAMLIESPVIMLLSTSVALVTDSNAYLAIKRFAIKLNVLVTVGMLIISIPWVFDFVSLTIIDLPTEVASLVYWGMVCLIPWPGAIGYRRFYQGLLIRHSKTKRVAYGTVVRLLGMLSTAFVMMWLTTAHGIVIGTLSLSVGVVLEALATRWMSRDVVRQILKGAGQTPKPPPTTKQIMKFYFPLAMTSAIGFVVTPMLAFFIVRAPLPVESLAVLPVVDSFVFLFRSFGFSYQEVGIALLGRSMENYAVVRKVGLHIIGWTSALIVLIAFTPLSAILYGSMYGLPPALATFAVIPTMLLVPLPALAVLFSLKRAVLITHQRNVVVTWSTLAEVGCIALVMIICTIFTGLNGAVAAAIAMTVGRVFANFYLHRRSKESLRGW